MPLNIPPINNKVTGDLPDFPTQIPGIDKDFSGPKQYTAQDVIEMLKKTPMTSLTNTALPYMSQLLGEQGKYIEPQLAGIRESTAQNVAAAQSDAMKRGLTGSDIEASAMQGARAQGQQAEAGVRANVAMQQSQTLAQSLFQALNIDIERNRELYKNIAQAIGQAVSGQQSVDLMHEQISAALAQAGMNQKAQMWSSLIGAGGLLGYGGLMNFSDSRLKERIEDTGRRLFNGIRVVKFFWNSLARSMGAPDDEQTGVIAQEVKEKMPEAVCEVNGYLAVNYSMLGG